MKTPAPGTPIRPPPAGSGAPPPPARFWYPFSRYAIAGPGRGCRGAAWLALLLLGAGLASSGRAYPVTLVGDLTYPHKWSNELRQWNRVVEQLRAEVKQTGYLTQWTGDPKKHAAGIVGGVASVLDPTRCALALAEREQAQKEGRTAFGLARTGRGTLQPAHRVETSVPLLQQTFKRDEARYTAFAEQAALLARHDEAIRQLRAVEQQELKLQKGLLERLRSAGTHAEMAAIQAALTASQQRCALAANKAEQARDEALRYEAQWRLEQARKREADREWTEALVDKLKQRALTSLHAQHGENF